MHRLKQREGGKGEMCASNVLNHQREDRFGRPIAFISNICEYIQGLDALRRRIGQVLAMSFVATKSFQVSTLSIDPC
jgi:hypothetical protein